MVDYIHWTLYFTSFFVYLFNSHKVEALESENINGGFIAPEGAYKYFVSLQSQGTHFCGGAIIGDSFVITAAHCVVSSSSQKFEQGLISITRRISDAEIIAQVEKIYVPRAFRRGLHDIAVLKLSNSLNLYGNPLLSKVDLPTTVENYEGQTAEVPGSGYDEVKFCSDELGNRVSCNTRKEYRLKVLQTHIISNEICQTENIYSILPTHICGKALEVYAGLPGGICDGDSGGPVVIGNTLIGVVSVGPNTCDETLMATMFTKVSSYLPFIIAATADVRDNSVRVAQYYPLYSTYIEI